MEFLDAVFSRRTTNGPFRPDPVSPEHQQLLIRAAAAAPSQFNSQPWRFVLIEDPTTIERIALISGESMTQVMSEGTFFHRYRKYFRFSQREMDETRSGMLFDRLPTPLRPFTGQVFTSSGQKLMNRLRVPRKLGEENRKLVAGSPLLIGVMLERGGVPPRGAVRLLLGVQHGCGDGEPLADHHPARDGHPVRLLPDGGAGELEPHHRTPAGAR